jgi:uncharacterized protein YjbI with pentapeptide repeats
MNGMTHTIFKRSLAPEVFRLLMTVENENDILVGFTIADSKNVNFHIANSKNVNFHIADNKNVNFHIADSKNVGI